MGSAGRSALVTDPVHVIGHCNMFVPRNIGICWHRHIQNPVCETDPHGTWRAHTVRGASQVFLSSSRNPILLLFPRFRVGCFVHLIYLLLDLSDEALAIEDWREWQQLFARLPSQHRSVYFWIVNSYAALSSYSCCDDC